MARHATSDDLYARMNPQAYTVSEREKAAIEIGKRGQSRGEQVLLNSLNDPSPKVQVKVIHALAVEMYDRKAAPAILPLIHSDNPEVADKAISALVHLDYRPAIPELKNLRDTANNPKTIKAANAALVHFERQG